MEEANENGETPVQEEPAVQAQECPECGAEEQVPQEPVQEDVQEEEKTEGFVPSGELIDQVNFFGSKLTDAVLNIMRQVNEHNEEFLKNQQVLSDRKVTETENRMVVEMAKLFEKYIKLNSYCARDGVTDALERYQRFEKDFVKTFSNLGVELGEVAVGDDALAEGVEDKIDIIYQRKGPEEEWNRICDLADAHYYVYKGQVVKLQKVSILREEDGC